MQKNRVNWVIDAQAGTFSAGPSETSSEAESSTQKISNGAKTVSCAGCSGASEIGYIGCSNAGTLTFPAISSTVDATTSIRVHYTNGDSKQRYANVIVNGVTKLVAFVPTDGDRSPKTSVLTVPLKSGNANSIRFEGYNGDCGKLLCLPIILRFILTHVF